MQLIEKDCVGLERTRANPFPLICSNQSNGLLGDQDKELHSNLLNKNNKKPVAK